MKASSGISACSDTTDSRLRLTSAAKSSASGRPAVAVSRLGLSGIGAFRRRALFVDILTRRVGRGNLASVLLRETGKNEGEAIPRPSRRGNCFRIGSRERPTPQSDSRASARSSIPRDVAAKWRRTSVGIIRRGPAAALRGINSAGKGPARRNPGAGGARTAAPAPAPTRRNGWTSGDAPRLRALFVAAQDHRFGVRAPENRCRKTANDRGKRPESKSSGGASK